MIALCTVLGACQSDGIRATGSTAADGPVPDVPITQGRYLVGEPYVENGIRYKPLEDWTYNEVVRASWYGRNYHGKRTANGETFDLRALTAAHPTLPLPSRVRVTNIENGKSIEVRVNDRGPFVRGRMIDLSERAAELLGFKKKGTAMVRVEMLGRAPLEMFRMARPKGPQPDLPVRAAPSAEVKAAELPVPGTGPAEETVDGVKSEESEVASLETSRGADQGIRPAPDPVGELISRIAPETGSDDASAETPAPEPRQDGSTSSEARQRAADEPFTSSVNGRFFVQAGAFTVPENAYSLRRLIIKAISGANVSINPAQVGNREFFRVRVGPFESSEEADGILAQLRNLGQNEARIISD